MIWLVLEYEQDVSNCQVPFVTEKNRVPNPFHRKHKLLNYPQWRIPRLIPSPIWQRFHPNCRIITLLKPFIGNGTLQMRLSEMKLIFQSGKSGLKSFFFNSLTNSRWVPSVAILTSQPGKPNAHALQTWRPEWLFLIVKWWLRTYIRSRSWIGMDRDMWQWNGWNMLWTQSDTSKAFGCTCFQAQQNSWYARMPLPEWLASTGSSGKAFGSVSRLEFHSHYMDSLEVKATGPTETRRQWMHWQISSHLYNPLPLHEPHV